MHTAIVGARTSAVHKRYIAPFELGLPGLRCHFSIPAPDEARGVPQPQRKQLCRIRTSTEDCGQCPRTEVRVAYLAQVAFEELSHTSRLCAVVHTTEKAEKTFHRDRLREV